MEKSLVERKEKIVEKLGQPYFQDDYFMLYNRDCIPALNLINDDIFDLTVTSPPYNIGKNYENIIATREYLEWSETWIKSVFKCTSFNGSFWLNLGYFPLDSRAKAIPIIYLLWDKIPFYMIQEVIWHYGAGVAARTSLSPRNEKFLWYVKNKDRYTFNLDSIRDPDVKYPNQKKNGKLRCNPLGKNPGDVWIFPKVTSGTNRSSKERTAHPAQFPEAVLDRVIKASSGLGDLLLDPFMGSGTTAVVARNNGRHVVGFEIMQDYCDIAIERYKKLLNH